MKVLVVGNGAREHAITWKLGRSDGVTAISVAPGNAGTGQIATNVPIDASDVEGLVRFAKEGRVGLTVVGPEGPLAEGIADRFQEEGLLLFGPTRDAARIESSKSFAKQVMLDAAVPTGSARVFDSYEDATAYVESVAMPVVVKADGLAAGKGVTIATTRRQAMDALKVAMVDRQFDEAGDRVLIEEILEGPEVSVFAFVDGRNVSAMAAACDYKRIGDGDVGPNTGGMGSFSPPRFWNDDLENTVRAEVMEPVANALADRGTPYHGMLYAGLMLTAGGPKVLEFNCRLGDPETQVVLPRLKTDLAEVMIGAARGDLGRIEWDSRPGVGVVMASGGYPNAYAIGYPIDGLDNMDEGVLVFHAGTKHVTTESGATEVVTDGGRVLTVTAFGETIEEARVKAYANVRRVLFDGAVYRNDIAAAL
jgi:phosphoribosylamine--glycine ligase